MQYDFTTPNPKNRVHLYVKDEGVTDPMILPHSVAEMRFNLAPEITAAMHACVDEGCFGYQPPDSGYYPALQSWLQRRHGWQIEPEWVTQTPGVVVALGLCIRAFTQPGDGVIIQPPVYGPFRMSVAGNGRRLVENPLVRRAGGYCMDFDDLRQKAKQAKLLLLCSPHNPVGRVWTAEELAELGKICRENDLIVVSDEIHFDLTFRRHTVFTQAAPELAERAVICTAPSKTFNLAGNGLSNIIIPGEALRKSFQETASRECGHYLNTFAYAATQAAYERGGAWLDQCLTVIEENFRLARARVAAFCPEAFVPQLEGTYLMWVDFTCLHAGNEGLQNALKARQVFVNDGTFFGDAGSEHIRFNLAAPTKNVAQAMDRMALAVADLQK